MSKPQISDPVAQPNDSATSPDEMIKDRLLGSKLLINTENKSTPDLGLGNVVAIAAEPRKNGMPKENSVMAAPRSAIKRKNPEEMSKMSSWFPEECKIRSGVRSSGATIGLVDQYFIEPSGHPRLHSMNEVLSFSETGSKKRKSTSKADDAPSKSLAGLHKNSGKKGKKIDDFPKILKTSPKKLRKKNKKTEKVSNKSDNDVVENSKESYAKKFKESSDETSEYSSQTYEDSSSKTSDDAHVEHDDVPNMRTSTGENVPKVWMRRHVVVWEEGKEL